MKRSREYIILDLEERRLQLEIEKENIRIAKAKADESEARAHQAKLTRDVTFRDPESVRAIKCQAELITRLENEKNRKQGEILNLKMEMDKKDSTIKALETTIIQNTLADRSFGTRLRKAVKILRGN